MHATRGRGLLFSSSDRASRSVPEMKEMACKSLPAASARRRFADRLRADGPGDGRGRRQRGARRGAGRTGRRPGRAAGGAARAGQYRLHVRKPRGSLRAGRDSAGRPQRARLDRAGATAGHPSGGRHRRARRRPALQLRWSPARKAIWAPTASCTCGATRTCISNRATWACRCSTPSSAGWAWPSATTAGSPRSTGCWRCAARHRGRAHQLRADAGADA